MSDRQEKYHISTEAIAKKYQSGELKDTQVIDVREPEKWEVYHLEGSKLIPLGDLPSRIGEIDRSKRAYVLCAHGIRSIHAANYLLHQGIEDDVVNVDGGLAEVLLYLDEGK